jgi:hyperosmotically inducible protein
MKLKRLLPLLVLGVALYASDKSVAATDDVINTKVTVKLAEDIVVKGGGLHVDVKDGVVTLTGKVELANQKSKAEKLTKKVPGVKGVVNNIVVSSHVP